MDETSCISDPCPFRVSGETFRLTCRLDTPDPRERKVEFGISPEVYLTVSTGSSTSFAAGLKIVVKTTGEYAAVFLPLAQATLHEMEEAPVVRSSRESVRALGVESYMHNEEVVGQGVVSILSDEDVGDGVEAQSQGIADVVVEAKLEG